MESNLTTETLGEFPDSMNLSIGEEELTRLVNEKLTLKEKLEEHEGRAPPGPDLKDRFLRSRLILGKSETVKNNIIIKEEV